MGCGAFSCVKERSASALFRQTTPAIPLRSLTSEAEPSVCREQPRTLKFVSAVKVSVEAVQRKLQEYAKRKSPKARGEAQSFRLTLESCIGVLAAGVGGVILAVVDRDVVKDVQFAYLDGGLLKDLCRKVAENIHEHPGNFQALLTGFCAHSCTDRWQQPELEGLAKSLPQDSTECLALLEGNPKDGAFILSHGGTVVAAAGHLRYSSDSWQLIRADGRSCGTRHAAALALAEWLGTMGFPGAVFVRSDGGGVHVLIPEGPGEPPLALHFDSMRHRTQTEMLELFGKRVTQKGRRMRKVQPGMIRPGVRNERVVTCVNGRVTSDVTITDDTSMVVRAPTVSQELYVLPREKFEENWEVEGKDIVGGTVGHTYTCSSAGFKLHKPKPGIEKWIYKCTAADLELVPTGCFEASWGAVQPLREGDFLAVPATGTPAREIYLMDPDCVSCYAPSDVAAALEEPKAAPVQHLTQQDMLELFRGRIVRQGKLMQKVEHCMSRPGKRGERVVTCVSGRVISEVVISDDTSMVVRAPTMDQEMYVLSREKFDNNWETPGMELDDASSVNRLRALQGFRQYKPKPNLKWTYTVTEEDAALVPTGWFHAAWGALQPLQAGDCLAMPAPEERACEIYLMPMEVLTCHREVDQFRASTAPGPPGSVAKHCSQQDMLDNFRERILQRGRLMHKTKPGMLRPGRRGDRVVTYVGGRVISDVVIDDDTSMVVRAPTVDHEEYVLPREKFEANWEPEGEPLDGDSTEAAQLRARGFRLHRPRLNRKWVYEVQAGDLELVPTGWFAASWGALQPLARGDCLAMPAGRAPEVYLMPAAVLSCYEELLDYFSV